ncbi:MAG: sugar ABC transporter permease [Spirochaetaceae bacterium]|nr:sugar ABC transporter permease [Spirochaetaceae bacterium]
MLSEQNTALLKKLRHGLKDYTVLIALALIWFLFWILTDGIFLKPRNISNLFRQASIISFLATGMVLVIVLGNIDLSVGSVVGFLSAVTAFLQVRVFYDLMPKLFPQMEAAGYGIMSTVFTIIVVLILAALIGVWQGSLIAYLRIPAFIVTLGGMQIFRGGVLGVTQGKTITPIENSLVQIAQGYVSKGLGWIIALVVVAIIFLMTIVGRNQKKTYGFDVPVMWKDLLKATTISAIVVAYVVIMNDYRGIQIPVLILAGVALLISYVSTNTRFGRYAYAVGGNLEATRLSGINIKKTIFLVHVLMGILAGVAGIILTGYVAAGTVNAGKDYELETIASCVIGGTSLMGGKGTIIGAMVGSLIMASIVNGMSVMNMDIFWQYIVKGMVLILAVYIDVVSNKQKS